MGITAIMVIILNVVSDIGWSKLQLKVYNIFGKEVATFVNQLQSSGNYKVEFDGSNWPSGIYYYQLNINTSGRSKYYKETRKMLLEM